jgi:outer membrane receptor for ferrienterochelin and colicins
MNGLEGAYSQILINSRPIFSALAGVYGLEMLPASMVDRVEVVRGGGSVLYGGNAIAGTVNIITKDPIKNSFEAGINQSFTNFEAPDRTITFNGSIVSDKLDKGVTFFGYNRKRDPWDANGDGFSEIVKLQSNTFGFDAFWNTSDRGKLS